MGCTTRDLHPRGVGEPFGPRASHLPPALGAAQAPPKLDSGLGGERHRDRLGGVESPSPTAPRSGRHRHDHPAQELGRGALGDRRRRSPGQRGSGAELEHDDEPPRDALVTGGRPDQVETRDRPGPRLNPREPRLASRAELRAGPALRRAKPAARRDHQVDEPREHRPPDARRTESAHGAQTGANRPTQ